MISLMTAINIPIHLSASTASAKRYVITSFFMVVLD